MRQHGHVRTIGLLLVLVAADVSWNAVPGFAQTPVPADQCVLEVAAPADAILSVDGRDYGKRRRLSFGPLRPGQAYRSRIVVRFADGTTDERQVDIEAGRRVQIVLRGRGANLPELVVQTRRDWDFHFNLSPDGRFLAVGCNDSSRSVWDVSTGRRVRLFQSKSLTADAGVFHPDGRHIVTNDSDRVTIWDFVIGKQVGMFSNTNLIIPSTFSPDGRYILGIHRDSQQVLVLEYATGKTLHTFPGKARSLAISPDSRHCIIAKWKDDDRVSEVTVVEIPTGRTIHTWKCPGHVSSLAFMPSGEQIVVAASLPYMYVDGRNLPAEPGTISVRTVSSGESIRVLTPSVGTNHRVAILREGRHVLVGGDHIEGQFHAVKVDKAELWDVIKGERIRDYELQYPEPRDGGVKFVAPLPGGELVLVNDTLFKTVTGEKVRTINGVAEGSGAVQLSSDGRLCLLDNVMWDLSKGSPVRRFPGQFHRLSADGQFVFTATNEKDDHSIKMYDVRTGEVAQQFVGHTGNVFTIALSPDGRLLASQNYEDAVVLWDTATGRKLFTLPHDQENPIDPRQPKEQPNDLSFTRDSRTLVTTTGIFFLPSDGWIRQWDTRSGRLIRKLASPRHYAGAVSPSGRYVISGGNTPNNNAIVWDTTTGRAIAKLEREESILLRVALSPDDRYALTTYRDGAVILSSVPGGKRVRTLTGHTGWVWGAQFSRDGNHLITSAGDGARIWNVATGQELAHLMNSGQSGKDTDWLVATAEGLFDGSLGGRQAVTYRVGGGLNVVPVDRFFQDFYRPGLLAEIWRGNYPLPNAALGAAKAPVVRIVSPAKGGAVTTARITLDVEVADQGGGVKGPWLKHNGASVIVPGEPKNAGKLVTRTFEVALVEGKNELEVCAASADGSWESEPARLTVEHGQEAGDGQFHLVAVGINQYAETSLNLKFAASDAEAMAALFRKRGPELYGQDRIHVVQLLNDRATKEAIRNALTDVAKKAKPQDTLCVFLAGHGTMAGQRYFFIPHEFKSSAKDLTEDIRQQGLSGDELDDLVGRIPALKRIVIYDTCQSGGAIPLARTARDAFAFRRVVEAMGRAQGSFILAATAATDDAQEVADLGHGVLTYTLLAALGAVDKGPLKNRKTRPTDKMVLVRDWFGFAQDEVPVLTRAFFGSEQFIRFTGSGANFPVLPLADETDSQE